jgi:hypothetical protein
MIRTVNDKNRGQSLVELAVVLPVLLLGIVVSSQLIVLCADEFVMQKRVWNAFRQASLQGSAVLNASLVRPLWGIPTPVIFHRSSEIPNPWRPFKAMPLLGSTVQSPGYIVSFNVSSSLLPKYGIGWVLPAVPFQAGAEVPLEPEIPREE